MKANNRRKVFGDAVDLLMDDIEEKTAALFFMIPLFFIRICWWEVTMTVVIQIFCCRSFLPDEEFWSLYLRPPRGIMNSMIRSGLLCSVHTKILQRLICY